MQILNNIISDIISALNEHESPKFSRLYSNYSITHKQSTLSPVGHGRCLAGMHNVGSLDTRSVCRSVNSHQTLPVNF